MLFSVLSGKISFVGTLPVPEEKYRALTEEDYRYSYRTRVKAGYTGYAALFGEADSTDLSLLKMDLFYVQHYSLFLDLKLLLQSLIYGNHKR